MSGNDDVLSTLVNLIMYNLCEDQNKIHGPNECFVRNGRFIAPETLVVDNLIGTENMRRYPEIGLLNRIPCLVKGVSDHVPADHAAH